MIDAIISVFIPLFSIWLILMMFFNLFANKLQIPKIKEIKKFTTLFILYSFIVITIVLLLSTYLSTNVDTYDELTTVPVAEYSSTQPITNDVVTHNLHKEAKEESEKLFQDAVKDLDK